MDARNNWACPGHDWSPNEMSQTHSSRAKASMTLLSVDPSQSFIKYKSTTGVATAAHVDTSHRVPECTESLKQLVLPNIAVHNRIR